MTFRNKKRVLVTTALVCGVGILAFKTFRIWTVLSGPPDVEEYVNHLDFQLLASAFLVVTRWLPLLGGLLLLELGVLSLLAAVRGVNRVPRP